MLADPKHVTGFQNVAPIVKSSVATAAGPKFTNTVNAVSAKLTIPAIVAMNKAFYVDKKSAASIAKAFLKANGLAQAAAAAGGCYGSRPPIALAAPSEPSSSSAAAPANHEVTSRCTGWRAMLAPSCL